MNEVELLLSKYNQFPRHELRLMGLIPKFDIDVEITARTGNLETSK